MRKRYGVQSLDFKSQTPIKKKKEKSDNFLIHVIQRFYTY